MSITVDLVFKLLIALALGALLGVERTIDRNNEQSKEFGFSGLRTFSLISLMGYLSAWLSTYFGIWILVTAFLLVGALLVISYYEENIKFGFSGITSEISALLIFLVGALVHLSANVATLVTVGVTFLLAMRQSLRNFTNMISQKELVAVIKFIIISFILLPLLPQTAIDPMGLLVPYNIWLMVIFVSGISFMGYILTKFVGGDRGIEITGLVGGLVSSTATTTSMAQASRKQDRASYAFSLAVTAASMVMFARVGFMIFVVNPLLMGVIWKVLLIMMVVCGLILVGVYLWHKHRRQGGDNAKAPDLDLESPFRLRPALVFGLFFAIIIVVSKYAYLIFGNQGLLWTAGISGLAETDAIVLSLSRMSLTQGVDTQVAAQGIMIATLTNTLVKMGIAYTIGGKHFRKITTLAFLVMLVVGVGTVFLI